VSILQIERVLNHSRTRGTDRAVLFALAWHAHDDGSESRAGRVRLARESGCDPVTLRRALARIEGLSELRRDHQGGHGPRDTNRYTITIDHAPGRGARCTPSCWAEGVQPVPLRGATSPVKGCTLHPEPTGTYRKDPADAQAHRRVAASRKPRKGPRTEPPDPRVKVLLDEFCRLHRETLHEPYRVVGGRDGKHIKETLRLWDADRILVAMREYFRDEKGLRAFPASVPHIVSRVAFLLSRSRPIGAAPTYVRADPVKEAAERAAADAAAAAYRAKKGWS